MKCLNIKNFVVEEGRGVWEYRALQSGLSIFEHEYVMVFFKPISGQKVRFWPE